MTGHAGGVLSQMCGQNSHHDTHPSGLFRGCPRPGYRPMAATSPTVNHPAEPPTLKTLGFSKGLLKQCLM